VAYFSGIAVNFALAWAFSRKVFTASIEEAAIMGMGAIFSNTVLLGLPLIYGAFGDEGLVALTLIIAFHSPILMPLVSLVIELGRGSAASLRQKLKLIFFAIFKNPIIVALLAGELYGAAAPCALFALGASLVGYRLGGDLKQCVALVGFKLLIHPAITALLVFHVFDLQPVWAAVAVVTAALPAGVNVFIMAEHYNIYKARAASAILISTGLSLVTVSILLAFFT
jgi:predicted permease